MDADLPHKGVQFCMPINKLVKTVHNHYDDITAYWGVPFSITRMPSLIKVSNHLYPVYSYEIVCAKTLFSAKARKVGSSIRSGRGKVEYEPHIPTLLNQAESGKFN